MDAYEYTELLKNLKTKLDNIQKVVNPQKLQEEIERIAQSENDASFWSDVKAAAAAGKQKRRCESVLNKFNNAKTALMDASELFELANAEADEETMGALFAESGKLDETIVALEIAMLLDGEDDGKNAIVSIHPGAGGTESNDWASMLYRMYLRFCEREGFKVETLDFQEGDEAGLKDVSFLVKGENAYGYFKTENGVHRLVRTSPFDSAGRRHTSFSSVMVSPEIDDDIVIEIDEKDLEIDVYRASGAGGQHVNKTESAVRITHKPSGIVVQCQNDRSQIKNRATAMKMLKSRLYELELAAQREANANIPKTQIAWGHQIRSYVLFPYQQVKDNRSGEASSQTDAILDGDIKRLIEGVLVWQKSQI